MAWPADVQEILESGMPLSSIGIDNWALNREQAILCIEEFEKKKIPVLGGDVYEMVDNNLESNYDNWYCDRNENEGSDDFVVRSIGKARDYIRSYNNPRGRDTFFVLVVQ